MSQSSNYNDLTPAETERLAILIEECGEVIQAGCKVLRHGYNIPIKDSGKALEINRQALQRELGDLLHALTRMNIAGDLDYDAISKRADSQPDHIGKFLHHQ